MEAKSRHRLFPALLENEIVYASFHIDQHFLPQGLVFAGFVLWLLAKQLADELCASLLLLHSWKRGLGANGSRMAKHIMC